MHHQDGHRHHKHPLKKSRKFLKNLAKRMAPSLRDILILWFAGKKPTHGYEMIKRFAELDTPELSGKANRIYPILEEMKTSGFLDVSLDPMASAKKPRKLYELTPEGRRHLLAEIEELRLTLGAVQTDLELIYRELKSKEH